MTREEAKGNLIHAIRWNDMPKKEALKMAIKALEQEPSEDCISRNKVLEGKVMHQSCDGVEIINSYAVPVEYIEQLPPVTPQPKTRHCKDCKYFEYDSVAKVNGIPLIVAHEICSRWGNGCKTKEDGYCFLFELQESEVSDADNN